MPPPRNLLRAIAPQGSIAYVRSGAERAEVGPAVAGAQRPATCTRPGIRSYAMKFDRTSTTVASRASRDARMVI
jgi:hypothetical protein